MIESEWLTTTDIGAMFRFLHPYHFTRKFRLFCCATCRAHPHLLDEHALERIEVVERYADGLATGEELNAIHSRYPVPSEDSGRADAAIELDLIRCIYGNPFAPVVLEQALITDDVVALAATIYETHDFGALLILADALQEAGCADAAILDHCRSGQPHGRGCFVVDAILGKTCNCLYAIHGIVLAR